MAKILAYTDGNEMFIVSKKDEAQFLNDYFDGSSLDPDNFNVVEFGGKNATCKILHIESQITKSQMTYHLQ